MSGNAENRLGLGNRLCDLSKSANAFSVVNFPKVNAVALVGSNIVLRFIAPAPMLGCEKCFESIAYRTGLLFVSFMRQRPQRFFLQPIMN
jgi:hypothetical protein